MTELFYAELLREFQSETQVNLVNSKFLLRTINLIFNYKCFYT